MYLRPKCLIVGAVLVALMALVVVVHRVTISSPADTHRTTVAIARAGPSWAYPDPIRTPGVINPEITAANVEETICNPNWTTKNIRPPQAYTNRLKRNQIAEWGLPGRPAAYEEDHFISLELGGHPTDPQNLWPEAYDPRPGAREKDVVERYLHKQVCAGAMTLEEARKSITTDWYKVYREIH